MEQYKPKNDLNCYNMFYNLICKYNILKYNNSILRQNYSLNVSALKIIFSIAALWHEINFNKRLAWRRK